MLHHLHVTLFLPISKTRIDHSTYLLSFMIFLQKTTNTFLIFMENLMTLQLRNIYKSLSISLTSLRYSMMMFVWGLFPNLCKEMLRNGLNICNPNPSIHGKSFLIYFWGFGVRWGHWIKYFQSFIPWRNNRLKLCLVSTRGLQAFIMVCQKRFNH